MPSVGRVYPSLANCAPPPPVLPARLPALPERQTAPQHPFPRKPAKIRRATQQRLCPTGANSVASAPRSAPCPVGARQRRSMRAVPAHHHSSASAASARPALPFTSPPRPPKTAAGGRPLLVGLPPSVPSTAPPETQRSAHAPCSWGMSASIPSRRRWPAALPAAAVCTLSRPIRTETQNTHPLLVGWVFVRSEPKALAAGTAG